MGSILLAYLDDAWTLESHDVRSYRSIAAGALAKIENGLVVTITLLLLDQLLCIIGNKLHCVHNHVWRTEAMCNVMEKIYTWVVFRYKLNMFQ